MSICGWEVGALTSWPSPSKGGTPEASLPPCVVSVRADSTQPFSPLPGRALGTPNNDVWPEVESLQDYKNTFPKWKPSSLASHVKNLDDEGLDLLSVSDSVALLLRDLEVESFWVRNLSLLI